MAHLRTFVLDWPGLIVIVCVQYTTSIIAFDKHQIVYNLV